MKKPFALLASAALLAAACLAACGELGPQASETSDPSRQTASEQTSSELPEGVRREVSAEEWEEAFAFFERENVSFSFVYERDAESVVEMAIFGERFSATEAEAVRMRYAVDGGKQCKKGYVDLTYSGDSEFFMAGAEPQSGRTEIERYSETRADGVFAVEAVEDGFAEAEPFPAAQEGIFLLLGYKTPYEGQAFCEEAGGYVPLGGQSPVIKFENGKLAEIAFCSQEETAADGMAIKRTQTCSGRLILSYGETIVIPPL